MDIQDTYKNVIEHNVDYECKRAFVTGWLLAKFEEQLKQLPDARIDFNNYGIECRPKTREEAVLMLQIFGGRWTKELNEHYKDKINYKQVINNPFDEDWTLEVNEAPPPASCRIEEVEELVPASVRKVRKMVCPTGTNDEVENVVEPETDPSVETQDGTI